MPLDNSQEMISGELTHLRCEAAGAVGEQDLRLAIAAWIEKDLPRRRITGRVLETDAEVEVSQWNPCRFAAPADVNHSVLERQPLQKCGAGLGRERLLHAGHEFIWPGSDL